MESHSVMLIEKLSELGFFPTGSTSHINILHDDDCKTLKTGSGLDCRCNCEIQIGKKKYSFNKNVRQ